MKRYPKRARPLWGRAAPKRYRGPGGPTGLTFSFGSGVYVDATDWTPNFDGPIRHVGSIGVIAFDSPGGPADQFHQALAEASRDGEVLTMPHGATFEFVEAVTP